MNIACADKTRLLHEGKYLSLYGWPTISLVSIQQICLIGQKRLSDFSAVEYPASSKGVNFNTNIVPKYYMQFYSQYVI